MAGLATIATLLCSCVVVARDTPTASASTIHCHARPHPGIDLAGCNLRGSDFDEVNLSHANLKGANLNGSELVGANLTDSNLRGAHLSLTDLSDTRFGGADLSYVVSGSVIGVPHLPTNWIVIDGYLIGPRANLQNAQLAGADLSHTDLFDVRLTGANLLDVATGSVIGRPILPPNWKLIDGYLIGPGANLSGADFRKANLALVDAQGSNLTDANLSDANLAGANISNAVLTSADVSSARMNGANLDGVTSGSLQGMPVLPSGWLLVNGYFVGEGAILTNANFTDANLFGANLVSANLQGATLTGVISGSVQGQYSAMLPPNWTIKNGYLFGPGANLTDANLAGTGSISGDLQGANLTGADLTAVGWGPINLIDANMSNANLTGAQINDSSMDDVNLDGAILTDTNFIGTDMSTVRTDASTLCPNGSYGPCSNL